MNKLLLCTVLCVAVFAAYAEGQVRAGACKINGTLPIGTPLAGYNHDQRFVIIVVCYSSCCVVVVSRQLLERVVLPILCQNRKVPDTQLTAIY